MGLFSKLKKQEEAVNCADNEIVAIADGNLMDITKVKDEMFAQKMLGDGVAFICEENSVTLCSPANGTLSVLFPTGHAYGIKMNNGVEILVHIGINTVEANGNGFELLNFKQGDSISAGDPIVKVNMKKLRAKYDMSIMFIITNPNGNTITLPGEKSVKRGEIIVKM